MSNYSYAKMLSPVREWFRYHFFEKKLNSAVGIAVIIIFALMVAYSTALIDYRAGFGFVGLFLVVLFVILFMRYPYFGLYFLIVYSALPSILSRVFMDSSVKIEFGNIIDVLTLLLVFSVFTKPQLLRTKGIGFWGNPISTCFLILFLFYIVEALNPSMHSVLGWVSFIRKYIIILLSFYILFCLLNSWARIKFFIYFNIALTTALAIYSCKQQWFGITNFEMRWATASPAGYIMLLQGGLLRKWSTLSDPATSGILFSSVAVQCIILVLRDPRRKAKLLLAAAAIFNMLGYAYSGTRTATLMMIAGIAFYGVATIFEKRTIVFMVMAVSAFAFLMVMPYSPPSIQRIRSTFEGTKDISAAVREYDRHQVQPYLYEHPMGGGIFTCGIEGPKYNPGHFLMDFQPDSGYMKVFAEQGWIGFAILLITYFLIMSHAIHNFYRAVSLEIQNQSIALITMIFTLMVGQFSQFALGPYPQEMAYLGALVFFIKLPDLDKKTNESLTTHT
jgi:putative inorganic carbon (HCO3(-)) transporter